MVCWIINLLKKFTTEIKFCLPKYRFFFHFSRHVWHILSLSANSQYLVHKFQHFYFQLFVWYHLKVLNINFMLIPFSSAFKMKKNNCLPRTEVRPCAWRHFSLSTQKKVFYYIPAACLALVKFRQASKTRAPLAAKSLAVSRPIPKVKISYNCSFYKCRAILGWFDSYMINHLQTFLILTISKKWIHVEPRKCKRIKII